MLTVSIKINMDEILTLHAINVSNKFGKIYGAGEQLYEVYYPGVKGHIFTLTHRYEDGAAVLSSKLLMKFNKSKAKLSSELGVIFK